MGSNRKGSRSERKVVGKLDSEGWAVLRAPASGAGTDREAPDVFAGRGDVQIAVELKSTSDDRYYFTKEEVEDLRYWADKFGADTLLGVDFPTEYGDPCYGEDAEGVYFGRPEAAHETESSYRVDKDVVLSDPDWVELSALGESTLLPAREG